MTRTTVEKLSSLWPLCRPMMLYRSDHRWGREIRSGSVGELLSYVLDDRLGFNRNGAVFRIAAGPTLWQV